MGEQQDIWSRWLLDRRFGGDPARMQKVMDFLRPVRDRVLDPIDLKAGETLLDVGAGDGLIAFGALERFPDCRVILSEISEDLIAHSEQLASEMGVRERTGFVRAPAEDLAPIAGRSVDAVTTRSVLIYIRPKRAAFNEFYRVLKPQGVLSIFEPINRFGSSEPDHMLWGYDVTPVQAIAGKVGAVYTAIQPADDPMLDFDERDLLRLAEQAGFAEVYLDLQVEINQRSTPTSWENFTSSAPNPRVPTFQEAMEQVLTRAEIARLSDHLRPLVERGESSYKSSFAYLRAIK